MFARAWLLVGIAAVVVAGGCVGHSAPTSSVDDTTFVHTMVDLQRAFDDSTLDSLMLDSVRHVILRRHGLTADELVQTARALSYDPDRAIQVWKAIDSGRYTVATQAAPLRHESTVHAGHATTPGPPR